MQNQHNLNHYCYYYYCYYYWVLWLQGLNNWKLNSNFDNLEQWLATKEVCCWREHSCRAVQAQMCCDSRNQRPSRAEKHSWMLMMKAMIASIRHSSLRMMIVIWTNRSRCFVPTNVDRCCWFDRCVPICYVWPQNKQQR